MFLDLKEKDTFNVFVATNKKFLSIPSNVIAYWLNDNFINIFNSSNNLIEYAVPRQGLATGDNNKFLRLWSEVSIENVKLNSNSREESLNSDFKWFPYNKGGEFRKWFGNNDYIINWENNGYELKKFEKAV